METTTWDLIKEIYEKNFNVEGTVIDYIAINDILLQCVSGLSNKKISFSTDVDLQYVEATLFTYLGFSGWKQDLDLSPWYVYQSVYGSRFAFEKKINDLTKLVNDDIIDLAYRICSIYDSIKKEIEKFYEYS
jgi:hypothetical protein